MENKIKFDMEYATQYLNEVKFLKDNGIVQTFIKTINGAETYKYKKDRKLFEALLRFYYKY